MPRELPEGWIRTRLDEICLPIETIKPEDAPDTEFTYFDIGGIDNEANRVAETKTLTGRNAPSRARQVVREGDILFSTVRTYLRNIARVDRDYPNPVASTGFTVIRPAEGVSSEFLFFQILSDAFLEPLHKLQTGTSYPAVRDRDVLAQEILLPPVRQQEQIAAKLNTLFARINRAKIATRRAQERLQRYRAAVLHAAVTGELIQDWRRIRKETKTGEAFLQHLLANRRERWEAAELQRLLVSGRAPKGDKWKSRYHEAIPPSLNHLLDLPRSWTWASIDQLSWFSGYGTSVRCTPEAGGPAVLRIPNIRNNKLDFSDLKFATTAKDFADSSYLEPGDFLLIRTNGSKDLIGRAAVVQSKLEIKCTFASYLIRFRLVGDEALWSWIVLAWNSPFIRARLEAKAVTTAGQYNLSLSRLADIAIPLPPPVALSEIVNEVEQRLQAADRLAAAIERQLTRSQATRQTLLHEAFSGNLVPQDPTDESASVVLERIRFIRKAVAEEMKEKDVPKSKPRSNAGRRPLIDVLREHRAPMTPEQLFTLSGYLEEFHDNESRQEIVDSFYDELRQLVGPKGPVQEERPNSTTVFLKVR